MQVPEPRKVLLAQGVYYVVTGVSPFVSRRLFEAVTGRKREWWLVKTAGVLVTAVGCGTVSAVLRGRETPEVVAMAAGCAAGLAAIDTVYALRGRISPVYLVDAALQLAAIAGSPLVRATPDSQVGQISDRAPGRGRVAH